MEGRSFAPEQRWFMLSCLLLLTPHVHEIIEAAASPDGNSGQIKRGRLCCFVHPAGSHEALRWMDRHDKYSLVEPHVS